MFIKKSGDGKYYLYKRSISSKKRGSIAKDISKINNIFLVRRDRKSGYITSNIGTPKELIGKRVMLKLIILEE